MATYRRFQQHGAAWFFTLVAEGRKPVLHGPHALHAMARAMIQVRSRYAFDLLAWSVLPDHIHVLTRLPEGDSAFARRISIFKRLVSKRLVVQPGSVRASMRKRRESGLWQRRFWEHLIRNEEDLRMHVDYIHYNPVEHGVASTAAAWPHSSFHQYVRRGLLPLDWAAADQYVSDGFGE